MVVYNLFSFYENYLLYYSFKYREWLNKHFPSQQLFPVSDFVDNPDRRFNLQAANSSDIEFDGVALLNLTLSEEEEEGMLVPVLVASGKIAEPILGYNVTLKNNVTLF